MKTNLLHEYGVGQEGINVGMEDRDSIRSEEHTLFFEDDLDEGEVQKYRLFLSSITSEGTSIHPMLDKLLESNKGDTLEVRIKSGGGSVDEGIRLISLFKEKFSGNVTTWLNNTGGSMASVIFIYGDKRVVDEQADIMFHNYSTLTIGKGGEIKDRLESVEQKVEEVFVGHALENGFLTQEELNRLKDGKDYYFDSAEMLKRGIATHISYKGEILTQEEYNQKLSLSE